MILSEHNDQTLVSLSLLGDDRAYEELVKRWQRLVIGSAYSVIGSYSLAEDAAQDAFVSAWLKLNTLTDTARFGGWVCRISKRRALDMLRRCRENVSLEACEDFVGDTEPTLDDIVIEREENAQLTYALSRLPEKIRTVVHLHYYEGLSIAEIAAKLSVPAGTVKWRLSDGRRRLGKEIAMTENEKVFVKSVMERVEAFKLWRLKEDKSGLENEYRELLRDIDKLPESEDKYHMEADVLNYGYWWVAGEENDKVFARMKEAAEKGHNEDVMSMVISIEHDKLSGKAKIEYIRDTQIPYLVDGGWKEALAYTWFWLGFEYHRTMQLELAHEAFDNVMKIARRIVYYATAVSAKRGLEAGVGNEPRQSYRVGCVSEEYRYIDGKLRFWSQPGYYVGYLKGYRNWSYIFHRACGCDGHFFDGELKVGESTVGSAGQRLTFVSDSEAVTVPAGVFESCQLWRTEAKNRTVDTYYADGVGIVKQICAGEDNYTQELISYNVSGNGLLPIAEGNRWEYRPIGVPEGIKYEYSVEIVFADNKAVTTAMYSLEHREFYDENSFDEMVLAMREGYCRDTDDSDGEVLCDVSRYIARAEELAKTSAEKAHIKAAASVMRRIFGTDEDANPNRTASGHWNFFQYCTISNKDGKLCAPRDYKYDFEWKNAGNLGVGYPLLYNFIYGIIEDITGTLWSDEWVVGYSKEYEYKYRNYNTTVNLKVTDAGRIETAAGVFDNCISVWFNARGYSGGLNYHNGRKEYFFAPGVGIVRARFVYGKTGEHSCDYDLVEYEGVGDGMMPMGDGFMRRYEAQGLEGGFEAGATYYYADDNGTMRIFADQLGIKHL